MKTPTAKPKKPTGRPPNPLPDRIPDTPENIMRVLVSTPPKKRREWRYLKSCDAVLPVRRMVTTRYNSQKNSVSPIGVGKSGPVKEEVQCPSG